MDFTQACSVTQRASVADWPPVVATFIGVGLTLWGVIIAQKALNTWRKQVLTERKLDAIIGSLCALDAVEQSVGLFRRVSVTSGEPFDFRPVTSISASDGEQASELHHKEISEVRREIFKSMWQERGNNMAERREQLLSKMLLCSNAKYVAEPDDLRNCLKEMNELLESLAKYTRLRIEHYLCPNSFQYSQEKRDLEIACIELNPNRDNEHILEIPDERRWNFRWKVETDRVREAMKHAMKECREDKAPFRPKD